MLTYDNERGENAMSINYAILGILSCKPLTGYDLKKIIQDSSFMYWSGNNNQIYKSLVELLDEGFVTNEVQHQESAPSKKIYTITKDGLDALKDWVLSSPEAPEFKKTFLIRLAWAGQLTDEELDTLLTGYENEIKMQILMQQGKKNREFSPGRTPKESYLWEMIYENIISSYENELRWVRKLRKELSIHGKETNKMNFKVVEKSDKKYIEIASAERPLYTEQDAVDIITLCFENNAFLLMLHAGIFSEDFFKLRTGVAGQMLQKFTNYRAKVAILVTGEEKIRGKFKELLTEANRGNDFRVFGSAAEAEPWLLA